MAIEQLLRGIDHKAMVFDRAPRIQASAELETLEPRVDGRGEEIRDARLALAVVRRPGDQKVAHAKLCWRDIVQPAHRVAATARQPGINRRRDTERTEIRGGLGQVVGDAHGAEISY